MNYDPETETRIAKWREFVSPLMDKIASEQRLVAELRKTEAIQSATIRELRAHVEALQAKIKDYNDDCLSACVARRANGDCEAWTSRGMKCCDCPTDDMIEIDGAARQPPEGQT